MAGSVSTAQTRRKAAKRKSTLTRNSNRTSLPVSSSFPQRVRKAINMAADDTCFMCDLEADHCAHVIAEADRSVQILSARGLINFDLMSAMNGVALCASCHLRYDDKSDPRLIFYPKDIDFFIAFELRDRARRHKDGSSRSVPTAVQYAKRGGLYTRIVFRRRGKDAAIVKEPAHWDGAPLGALKRAFDIMGCPRADGIPEGDMQRLRDLWDLYFRDNDDTAQRVAARYGFSPTEEDFGLGGVDSDNDEQDLSGEGSSDDEERPNAATKDLDGVDSPGLVSEDSELKMQKDDYKHGPSRKRRATSGTWQQPKPRSFNYRNWCWEFGPESSSNQKAIEHRIKKANSIPG